jgi:hypothetical protein
MSAGGGDGDVPVVGVGDGDGRVAFDASCPVSWYAVHIAGFTCASTSPHPDALRMLSVHLPTCPRKTSPHVSR